MYFAGTQNDKWGPEIDKKDRSRNGNGTIEKVKLQNSFGIA